MSDSDWQVYTAEYNAQEARNQAAGALYENKKLKDRISELEKQISDLEETVRIQHAELKTRRGTPSFYKEL